MKKVILPIPVIVGSLFPFMLVKFLLMLGIVISFTSMVAFLSQHPWIVVLFDVVFIVSTLAAIYQPFLHKNLVFLGFWWILLLALASVSLLAVTFNIPILAIFFFAIYRLENRIRPQTS